MIILDANLDNGTSIPYCVSYGKMTDTVMIQVPSIGEVRFKGRSIRDLIAALQQMGFDVTKKP